MTHGVTGDLRLLDGRYRLTDRLGTGGMGTVFRAEDTRLGRTVAVKVLRSSDAPDDRETQVRHARLRAEARFAGGLQHPGIVRVFDYGEEQTPSGTTPYVVMQLVEGTPLSERLHEETALPHEEVAALVAAIAEALAVAHAAGIVHRDLKPSNILVTETGPVLVDFGVARSDSAEPLTETGFVVGTADYFSPEQAEGQRATPASDVYSLGVVAHHCLTGTSPFRRDTPIATALAHLREGPPELPGGLPAGLRTLVRSMLAREPEERPTAAAVAALASTAPETRTVVVPPPPDRPPPRPGLVSAWTRRRVAVIAVAVVAILALGLLAAVQGQGPTAPPAEAVGSAGHASAADPSAGPPHTTSTPVRRKSLARPATKHPARQATNHPKAHPKTTSGKTRHGKTRPGKNGHGKTRHGKTGHDKTGHGTRHDPKHTRHATHAKTKP